jgi:aminopeptidase-like protein
LQLQQICDVVEDVKVTEKGYEVNIDNEGVKRLRPASCKNSRQFPADIYIYKNAKLISSAEVPNGMALNMESKDSVSSILLNMKKKCQPKAGNFKTRWTLGTQKMIIFKKEKQMAMLMLNKSDTITSITITSSKE